MAEGFDGLLDFVGYPVGQGEAVAAPSTPAGFHGLLDFVGFPVSKGVATPAGGGFQGAGKRTYYNEMMASVVKQRIKANKRRKEELERHLIVNKIRLRKMEGKLLERKKTGNAVWTVLFSEI